MNTNDNPERSLRDKVVDWLEGEGYPLEFAVAEPFNKEGFEVRQGHYVRDIKTNAPREIDIMANVTARVNSTFVRVAHVVECKWSKNKPWVVFTAWDSRISSAACIAHTVSSRAGEAIMWCQAGNQELARLDAFLTPSMPGFNGRQAFTKDNDAFYTAMQSVTSPARALASQFDGTQNAPLIFPDRALVVLPLIVVDGQLFTASYDSKSQRVAVEETHRVRLHWRGSETGTSHVSVDIVALSGIHEFAKQRRAEMSVILNCMVENYTKIGDSFRAGDFESLPLIPASRGRVGLPQILFTIRQLSQQKSTAQVKGEA